MPDTVAEHHAGLRRVIYEDLLEFQLALALRRKSWTTSGQAIPLPVTAKIDARIRRLFPFKFTAGQDHAIGEIAADLAQQDAPQQIFTFTLAKQIEIELLVNNAGFGGYGEFATAETQRLLDMVQVNCSAVVHLTRLYLPQMLKRRSGDVLILASTASFQAVHVTI